MQRKTKLVLAGVLVAGLGFSLGACNKDDDDERPLVQSVEVDLGERNDSGYQGQAVLASAGDGRTTIVMALRGGTDDRGAGLPVRVQRGTCDGVAGDIVHELDDVQGGFLIDTFDAPLEELVDGDFVVIAYQSGSQSVYLACGEIED